MNNKKVSCEAKNNDINQPKTRTVTIQMNCKSDVSDESLFDPDRPSEAPEREDPEEGDLPDGGDCSPGGVRGR